MHPHRQPQISDIRNLLLNYQITREWIHQYRRCRPSQVAAIRRYHSQTVRSTRLRWPKRHFLKSPKRKFHLELLPFKKCWQTLVQSARRHLSIASKSRRAPLLLPLRDTVLFPSQVQMSKRCSTVKRKKMQSNQCFHFQVRKSSFTNVY